MKTNSYKIHFQHTACIIIAIITLMSFTACGTAETEVPNTVEPARIVNVVFDTHETPLIEHRITKNETISLQNTMYPFPSDTLLNRWESVPTRELVLRPDFREYRLSLWGGNKSLNLVQVPYNNDKLVSPLENASKAELLKFSFDGENPWGYRLLFPSDKLQDIMAVSDGKVIEIVEQVFSDMTDPYSVAMMGLDDHIVVESEGGMLVRYLNIKPDTSTLQVGQEIKKGDAIGKTYGQSNAETKHPFWCSIDILIDGKMVDPSAFFDMETVDYSAS